LELFRLVTPQRRSANPITQHYFAINELSRLIYEATRQRVESRFAVTKDEDKRSVVDQLAEIATPPEEVRRLMREAGESAISTCRGTGNRLWATPEHTQAYVRRVMAAVYEGKRYSGFKPKRSLDKILAQLMREYRAQYKQAQIKLEREIAQNEKYGG
jgi:hypothetical protein